MDLNEYHNVRNRNDYFAYMSSRQEHDRIYRDILKQQDLEVFNEVDRIALTMVSLIIIAIIIACVVSVFRRSKVCECQQSEGTVYQS